MSVSDFPNQLVESGNLDPDIDTFVEIEQLFQTQPRPKRRNLLVLDIDQTVLINRAKTQRGTLRRFHGADVPRNEFVWRIYQLARRQPTMHIIFVTARGDSARAREFTERELHTLGYTDYDAVYYRDPKEHDFERYKSDVRKALELSGYDILLNIGDKWSDVNGGHARYRIKLPRLPRMDQFVS